MGESLLLIDILSELEPSAMVSTLAMLPAILGQFLVGGGGKAPKPDRAPGSLSFILKKKGKAPPAPHVPLHINSRSPCHTVLTLIGERGKFSFSEDNIDSLDSRRILFPNSPVLEQEQINQIYQSNDGIESRISSTFAEHKFWCW